MAKKKKTSKTRAEAVIFQKHPHLKWLLPTFFILFIFLLLYRKHDLVSYNYQSISTHQSHSLALIPSTAITTPFNGKITEISSGRKQYVNNYYEISFPSNYSFSNESGSGMPSVIGITSPENPNRGGGYELKYGELKIEVYAQVYTKSLDDYISSIKVGIDVPPGTSFQKIVFNGLPSVYSISNYSSGGEIYYFTHNGYLFSLAKYPLATTTVREKEYKEILSSFKFIN